MASFSLNDAQSTAVGVVNGIKKNNTANTAMWSTAALMNSSAEPTTLLINVSVVGALAGLDYVCACACACILLALVS